MLRLLTLLFTLATLGLVLHGGWGLVAGGGWMPVSLGEIWFAVHPTSLQLLQPAVERHLDPALWDPYLLSLLTAPAFLTAGGLALVFGALALAFRPRRRRTLMD